ncbi:MAG: hypothetical protein GXP25_11945 [Planctomycetes bacterium]|nr:hypothetical protein [Planctomycetota bacterium]
MGDIIRRTLKHTFWDIYDHVGTLIVVNLLAILFLLPIVTIPLALSGLFHVTHLIVTEQESGVRDFFRGMAPLRWRYTLVAGLNLVVCLICTVNIWFYLSIRKDLAFLGMLAAGTCFWFAVVFLLGQLYVGPLMCRTGLRVRDVYKLGLWLLVRHIGATVVVCFYLIFFLGLLLISGVGAILLGVVFPAILAHNLTAQAAGACGVAEHERAEEIRGFRDLIRPWGTD